MKVTAKCPKCEEVVKPSVFNHRAYEAKCPRCGKWFCYLDTSHRTSKTSRGSNGTLVCELIYNGYIK